MKQTEIGLIPDDWEVIKILGNYFLKGRIGWQGLKASEFKDQGPYLVTGTDFVNGRVNWNTCYHISEKRYEEDKALHVREDDILITKDGTIGKVAYVDKKPEKVSLNSHLLIIRPLKDKLLNRYLYYILNSKFFYDYYQQTQTGTTMASLSQDKISKFVYPLPSKEEQQRISKALSDVDALISTTEKLIQKKKNIKQGTMQNLLTGKKRLPGFAKSTNYKQSELGLIPDDWEVKNIMDILISSKDKLKIGPFGSQLKKEYLLSNGFYKVFGQENIYTGNFEYCYRFLTKEHFQKLQSCELKPGDFVISTMGTIGKCDIVPENAGVGVMDSHLVRLRLLNSMDKNFFKYFFQSDLIQKQIVALSVGGIMDGLSTAIIKKLNVIEFSKEEQTAIANVLSSMDNEIETLNTKLEKYRNLKTAMMQQLLTGKIRLV